MENIETIQDGLNNKVKSALYKENFARVPYILINDIESRKLIPTDIVVYIIFAHHQRKKSNSWPGNRLVAELFGCSVKSVARSINRLEAAGHISRNGKSKFGTRFTTLLTRVEDSRVIRGSVSKEIAAICATPADKQEVGNSYNWLMTQPPNVRNETKRMTLQQFVDSKETMEINDHNDACLQRQDEFADNFENTNKEYKHLVGENVDGDMVDNFLAEHGEAEILTKGEIQKKPTSKNDDAAPKEEENLF